MSGRGSGRWLDEDDPWLVLSRGLELTDRERGSTLSTAWTGRTQQQALDWTSESDSVTSPRAVFPVWASRVDRLFAPWTAASAPG